MNNKTIQSTFIFFNICCCLVAGLFVYILFLSANQKEESAQAYNFSVNTTEDLSDISIGDGICHTENGYCSLRAALQEANYSKITTTITFDLIGNGPFSINLNKELKINTDHLTIDGYSQFGSHKNTNKFCKINAIPLIHITGENLNKDDNILTINSSHNIIKGLILSNGPNAAIYINGNYNHIAGNYIGVNNNKNNLQVSSLKNSGNGIELSPKANYNIIGWAYGSSGNESQRNLISGNGKNGIYCNSCKNNIISGNLIGVSAKADKILPNNKNGILLENAFNNFIGTDGNDVSDNFEGNIISGNKLDGINQIMSHNTIISGNHIGICYLEKNKQHEPIKCPNGFYGISDMNGSKNMIGSDNKGSKVVEVDEKNIIAGNKSGGIYINNSVNNVINNNFLSKTPNGSIIANNDNDIILDKYNEVKIKDNTTLFDNKYLD